jgi:hypothetical protein
MQRDGTNVYEVKIQYAEVGLKSKSRWIRKGSKKSKKLYVISTPSDLEKKMAALESSLRLSHNDEHPSVFTRWFSQIKNFGTNCNQAYYRMLRS